MISLDCRFLWRCLSQITCARRLLGNFDAKVSDSAQLANYARSLLGLAALVCRKNASSRSCSMNGCENPWFHDLDERCIFDLCVEYGHKLEGLPYQPIRAVDFEAPRKASTRWLTSSSHHNVSGLSRRCRQVEGSQESRGVLGCGLGTGVSCT